MLLSEAGAGMLCCGSSEAAVWHGRTEAASCLRRGLPQGWATETSLSAGASLCKHEHLSSLSFIFSLNSKQANAVTQLQLPNSLAVCSLI